MHLDLPHLTYSGPPIDDEVTLGRLPSELATALRSRNGCVAYCGAIHVRGACLQPAWHSLRGAISGPQAFCQLHSTVTAEDVPFAEDAFGDQFLLRQQQVWRLSAETGELELAAGSLPEFYEALLSNIAGVLGYEPVQAVGLVGGQLPPGRLISVYPPFVMDTGSEERSYRAISAADLRAHLASFAAQIRGLPDGAKVEVKPVP